MEMTVPNSLRSFYEKVRYKHSKSTYNLVNGADLGLEDGNSVSNRWLFVGHGGGSEGSSGKVEHVLVLRHACDKLRQHICI
jgi:hypothetical protein